MIAGLTPPAGATPVYVAAARKGIEAHRVYLDGLTACNRSTRTGLVDTAERAVELWAVTWCPLCWTPGRGLDTTIEVGTVWRDNAIPNRRLRITDVSAILVTADVAYSSAPDAWDRVARTTSAMRKHWRHRYTPETQQPDGQTDA